MTDTHPEEIWARRYPNGVVGARCSEKAVSPLTTGDMYARYIRADLGSFYKESDIDDLQAQIALLERARDAWRKALDNSCDRVLTAQRRAEHFEAIAEKLAQLLDKVCDDAWIERATMAEVKEVDDIMAVYRDALEWQDE